MTFGAVLSIALASIVGFIRWPKIGYCQKVLTALLTTALITELLSAILRAYALPTYPGFHMYALLEYGFLVQIFGRVYDAGRWGIIIRYSWIPMLIFGILNLIIWQPLNTPNTNVIAVSGLIMITLSLGFLFSTLNRMRYRRIEKSALFWINVGVLLYFTSTLVMFVFLNGLVTVPVTYKIDILVLNIIFNIIHYLCFNIALWMKAE